MVPVPQPDYPRIPMLLAASRWLQRCEGSWSVAEAAVFYVSTSPMNLHVGVL